MNSDLMKSFLVKRSIQVLTLLVLGLFFAAVILLLRFPSVAQPQAAISPVQLAQPTNELAALRAELEQLKGKLPDQSHAMKDVGYHFANLWFAAQKKNWPLAKFYLDETRSHLKWAVRIIPIRKTKAGDLDLSGILEAVDNTMLSQIQNAIEKADLKMFSQSYRQTIEGCYSCHKAAEKAYLRLQVPRQPEVPVINFDPDAKWPQ